MPGKQVRLTPAGFTAETRKFRSGHERTIVFGDTPSAQIQGEPDVRAHWVPNKASQVRGSDSQIKSCIRVLDLLMFFARHAAPARSTTIADDLGWPKSSTHELLKCLVDSGFLSFREENKTYMPSFSLVALGSSFGSTYFAGDAVHKILRTLHDETGEIAGLYMENGNQMQCLASTDGKDFEPEYHGIGARVSMLSSSSGRACLANKPDSQIVAHVRQINCGLTLPQQIKIAQSVLETSHAARKLGYAIRPIPYPSGLSGVSVRFRASGDSVPLFVGMGNHKVGEEASIANLMLRVVREQLSSR